jgi:hypothetical protein
MKTILSILIILALASCKPRWEYLVTIRHTTGKTIAIHTTKAEIDSIFQKYIGVAVPDSLLNRSHFFEIRNEKLTFYCEKK